MFAEDLAAMLESACGDVCAVTVRACNDDSPESTWPPDPTTWLIMLTSTAGVGEPPGQGAAFYAHLKAQSAPAPDAHYALFGLGNSKAHPHHYNAFSKHLNAEMTRLQAKPIMPLALGDDGECLDDDFDQWSQAIVALVKETLSGKQSDREAATGTSNGNTSSVESKDATESASTIHTETVQTVPTISCAGAKRDSTRRAPRSNQVIMQLEKPPVSDHPETVRPHLMGTNFYDDKAQLWHVRNHALYNADPTMNGLQEIVIEPAQSTTSASTSPSITSSKSLADVYTTGDHCVVYPRNPDYLVTTFLDQILDDVDPYAVIVNANNDKYPYPTGLSVYETLSHCVDLQAIPSPATCRLILGRDQIQYKEEIVIPQRRVLQLLMESKQKWALEDILYLLPSLQPRYYSIASSNLVHPNQVYLTFRPVRYMTTQGTLQSGLCTNYMANLKVGTSLVASIQTNPTFRLPVDPMTPLVLMAGGCGVAPIRAFLEERIHMRKSQPEQSMGEAFLFLGFRNPSDQVYHDLIDEAVKVGALTQAHVTFNSGDAVHRGMVSDLVHEHGQVLYDHWQRGGYTYLCGGARTFGAAMERMVQTIVQEEGKLSDEQAADYLREMIRQGRFLEDLAD
jgi:NADPH-ferrihemoprotein reductase